VSVFTIKSNHIQTTFIHYSFFILKEKRKKKEKNVQSENIYIYNIQFNIFILNIFEIEF